MERAILFVAGLSVLAVALVESNRNPVDFRITSRDEISARDWRQREVARVKEHLAGAEHVLRSGNTEHFTEAQLAARKQNIVRLRQYRENGQFPRNLDFPGERMPYFVDDRGVPCAMAFLISSSGNDKLVSRIHETRNNARIMELASDAELVSWLEASGLALSEAARIQPTYDFDDTPAINPAYLIGSASASLVDGVALAWICSRDRSSSPHHWDGVLGTASGAVSIGLGVAMLNEGGEAETLGIWNTALGVVTSGFGLYALLRNNGGTDTPSALDHPYSVGPGALSISPLLGTTTGVRLSLNF